MPRIAVKPTHLLYLCIVVEHFIVLDASHFCPFSDVSPVSLSIPSVPGRIPFLAGVGLSVGIMIERTQVFQTGAITKLVLVLSLNHSWALRS